MKKPIKFLEGDVVYIFEDLYKIRRMDGKYFWTYGELDEEPPWKFEENVVLATSRNVGEEDWQEFERLLSLGEEK